MANYMNPTKPSGVQSWNSVTEEKRLGFALRDAVVTQSLQTPQVVPKLGFDVVERLQRAVPTTAPDADWSTIRDIPGTVPGIMVLDYVPVFAEGSRYRNDEVSDIFTNLWELLRITYNGTRDIQDQDIQCVYLGLMELRAHLANARRVINVVQSVVNHELSMYYSPEALLTALGFPMTEAEARQHAIQWINYYNVTLLGNLSKIRWFTGLVPGEERWAGLCSEIYKDNPEYTDYCQLYLLRPQYMMFMMAKEDEEEGFYWTWEVQNYMTPSTSTNGVQYFTEYLASINEMVRSIFYDDSTCDIIALLNALLEKHLTDKITGEFLNFERIPLEGEEVKLTYDFNMLLAIQNSTILDLVPEEPRQDVLEHRLLQQFYLNCAPDATGTLPARLKSFLTAPKLLNLPNFGATTADLINATQWNIVSTKVDNIDDPTAPFIGATFPNSLATDYISRVTIIQTQYDPTHIGAYRFYTAITMSRSLIDVATTSAPSIIRIMKAFGAFSYAPTIYFGETGLAQDPNIFSLSGVLCEDEVQYVYDAQTAYDRNLQFRRNFWGYPFYAPASEPFKTSFSK